MLFLIYCTIYSHFNVASSGFLDGALLKSEFSAPSGISIDNHGNLYVADTYNQAVRFVTKTNTTTFAGSGYYGLLNGIGSDSEFYYPYSVTNNQNGSLLFVMDTSNNVIRQISCLTGYVFSYGTCYAPDLNVVPTFQPTFTYQPTFTREPTLNPTRKPTSLPTAKSQRVYYVSNIVTTTFAGTGNLADVDGTGNQASFYYPSGLCIDPSNEYFVVFTELGIHKLIVRTAESTSIGTSKFI